MSRILSDIRHGIRLHLRTPGVTATALFALALAIGANTAMFSIVDAVLLRPLPLQDPDRLVMVWEDSSKIGFPRNTPAPANWNDWRKENSVFTDIAATRGASYSLTGDGAPERVTGRRVTGSFWTVLGATPLLGRAFTAEEDRLNAKVAVLSHSLWQRRYGADPHVLGRKILLSDEPFELIGVMPPEFSFPHRRTELWTPASFTPAEIARRGSHFLQCVARLRPGITLEQAQSEMRVIAKRLEDRYPESNRNVGAVVVSLSEQMTGGSRTGLIVLFAASGFVLLIACANVANLLLAKAMVREREIAVRTALGAGRRDILRQLLTESLLLSTAGALLGVAFARLAMVALEKLVPRQMAAVPLELDARMLLFTVFVTVGTAIFFGILPALMLGRVEVQDALKQGGRTSSSGGRRRLREMLVVSQTALALALLSAAGLMIQTLYNLQQVDLGLRTDRLLTLTTELARSRYPDHAKREAFLTRVLEVIGQIPGVLSAGYTSDLPLTAIGNTSGYIIEEQRTMEANNQDALFRVVTPDFLDTIGARLREGRMLNAADRAGTQPAVLVNETFADRHWRGQSALGRRIAVQNTEEPHWLTVMGVVKEIRERGINIDTKPAVYMPLSQSASYWPVPDDLAVRAAVEPASLVSAIRSAIASVDRDQPISDVRTMDQAVDEQLMREQQQMWLLAVFGLLALVLAATGIYGVITYAVSQQRREIGVRMALGAQPSGILAMVLRRGSVMVVAGVVVGVGLSVAGSRLISTMLFGVRPSDPLTLGAAAAILAAVALAACTVPAVAASRVDPATVLREE
jgi:putative ABC transport system permease protein